MQVRLTLLACLNVFLVAVCVYGAIGVLAPSYTDQEIRTSLVDTWQVEALFTSVSLVLLAFAFVAAVIFALRGNKGVRVLASLAVLLAVSAATLVVAGHVILTNRVVGVTGQTFGGFYGLF